jgi:hypothetical protein
VRRPLGQQAVVVTSAPLAPASVGVVRRVVGQDHQLVREVPESHLALVIEVFVRTCHPGSVLCARVHGVADWRQTRASGRVRVGRLCGMTTSDEQPEPTTDDIPSQADQRTDEPTLRMSTEDLFPDDDE